MSAMKARNVLIGLASYVPRPPRKPRTVGGADPGYCYGVWLRHLVLAHQHGAVASIPRTVTELGPGDSLGVGLAALLSGAARYVAFDVVRLANTENNLAAFEDLVQLFRNRAAIPDDEEFPRLRPDLPDYAFPHDILTEAILRESLTEERLRRIRGSIERPDAPDSLIRYKVPWYDADIRDEGSVDLILSQAVLQHLDDIRASFRIFHSWLRPGGVMSHQVDLTAGRLTREWNEPWTYTDPVWRIVRGRRPYLLNREPLSGYKRALDETGFELVHRASTRGENRIPRSSLAPRFADLSDEDLTTKDAYFLAVKR
jgi:SAM-dependent methyltransferase